MRMLVAEDDLTSRLFLLALLRKQGHEVIEAADGIQAWDCLCRPDAPRMVILDWMMPGLDGIELCRRLRGPGRSGYTYVIMQTARESQQDIHDGFTAGVDDYLVKPLDKDQLLYRVRVGERLLQYEQKIASNQEQLARYAHEMTDLAEQRARQLLHADRMATLGTLSAGIAHEINNPATFIAGNAQTMQRGWTILTDWLDRQGLIRRNATSSTTGSATGTGSSSTTGSATGTGSGSTTGSGPVAAVASDHPVIAAENHAAEAVAKAPAAATTHNATVTAEDDSVALIVQEFPHMLDGIRKGVQRISKIVSGLKNYARQDISEKQPFDLHEAIRASLELCRNALKYDMTVQTEIPDSLPLILGDKGRIEQVLVNLLTNAADAITTHHSRSAQPGRLTITVETDDRWVHLSVADNGPGIRTELLDKLFNPFFTTKAAAKGTGLGLSISKGIVEEHGGELIARNAPDGGAVFSFSLPVAPATAPSHNNATADAFVRAGHTHNDNDNDPVTMTMSTGSG